MQICENNNPLYFSGEWFFSQKLWSFCQRASTSVCKLKGMNNIYFPCLHICWMSSFPVARARGKYSKCRLLPPLKMDNFLMKTPKRSVVNGHICNQQGSSSLTMAPTISKEKSTPNTIKTPVKIKKEKSQNKRIHKWKDSFLVTYKWLRKIEGKLFCMCCCKFPQYHKSMELAKWFSGNTKGNVQETCQLWCQWKAQKMPRSLG